VDNSKDLNRHHFLGSNLKYHEIGWPCQQSLIYSN
jgi:hypothetical protein